MVEGFFDQQQQRDRQLAARPRFVPRRAAPLSEVLGDLMASPQIRRIKRQCHLTAALSEVLKPAILARVSPQRWHGNTLTLAVQGSPLLAEIRQFYQHELLNAFMRHGLGISSLRLQLAPPVARGAHGDERGARG